MSVHEKRERYESLKEELGNVDFNITVINHSMAELFTEIDSITAERELLLQRFNDLFSEVDSAQTDFIQAMNEQDSWSSEFGSNAN